MATIYETNDGQQFKYESDAQKHANNLAVERAEDRARYDARKASDLEAGNQIVRNFNAGNWDAVIEGYGITDRDVGHLLGYKLYILRSIAYAKKGDYKNAFKALGYFWTFNVEEHDDYHDVPKAESCRERGLDERIRLGTWAVEEAKKAFANAHGRTMTEADLAEILEAFIVELLQVYEAHGAGYIWAARTIPTSINWWENITNRKLNKAEQIRISGSAFPKDLKKIAGSRWSASSSSSSNYSSSSYSDEPRSIGSKLLGILFGIIGAVVLLAIVMILLSILDNPILNLLGLLGSPVAGFILGYKLSRSLAAKLIILALLIGGGIFVWYNLSLLGPFSGKAQTVSETAATATVNANVNFRKEPTTGDNIIRQLQQGEIVTLTGEVSGGWTQINHEGDTGWISTEFLSK